MILLMVRFFHRFHLSSLTDHQQINPSSVSHFLHNVQDHFGVLWFFPYVLNKKIDVDGKERDENEKQVLLDG